VDEPYSPAGIDNPDVVLRTDQEFLVVWDRYWYDWTAPGGDCDSTEYQINGRLVSAVDGSLLSDTFHITSSMTRPVWDPAVLADNDTGKFAVAWRQEENAVCNEYGNLIKARSFDSPGNPMGDAFLVNTLTSGAVAQPSITADPGSGFLVSWNGVESAGSDLSGSSIQARLMSWDGTPVKPQFQANSNTTGDQDQADFENGVLVWRSATSAGTDTSGFSIQATRVPLTIFLDDFESGDVTAWTSSVN
jgi:hypothetical protein